MKKKLMVITAVIFLSFGFSCEDSLEDVSHDTIMEVENQNDDEEQEDELPPIRNNNYTS